MTEATKPRERKPVTPFNHDHPLYVVVHQTETSNSATYFNGPDAEQEAKAHASDRAITLSRKVTIFNATSIMDKPDVVAAMETTLAPAQPA